MFGAEFTVCFHVNLSTTDCCPPHDYEKKASAWRERELLSIIMASRKDPITENIIDPLWQFAKQSKMLINVCTKPDRKEFTKHIVATSMGFLVMGFIGFFVKVRGFSQSCCSSCVRIGAYLLASLSVPQTVPARI